MTPVQGTTANTVNWQSLLDKLVETSGADGASKISDSNRTLVLTTNVNGVAGQITVNIPDDLDLPGEVDEAAIESLVEKLSASGVNLTEDEIKVFQEELTKVYKDMSAALNQVTKTSTGSVMLDLYKLMALMVEIGQSQRDAARELRTAQSAQIQNSIQSQANQQRDAAMVGLIVGVVCGAASVIASCVMVGLQGAAYKDQLSAARSSGTDAAQSNANMIKGADTLEHANAQLTKVEGQVGGDVASRVKGEMDGHIADTKSAFEQKTQEVNAKQQALDNAQSDLTTARATRTAKTTAVTEAQQEVDTARAEAGIQDPQKTATAAKADYIRDRLEHQQPADDAQLAKFDNAIRAESKLATAKTELEAAPSEQAIANKEFAVSNANDALQTAKTEQQTARANYRAALQSEADMYMDKYEAAVAADGPNSDAAQKARNEMRMAQAYAGSKLAEEGVTTQAEHRAEVVGAKDRVDRATQQLNANEDYRGALHRIERYTAINAINTSISNVLQGMTQNITGMMSAEATKKGAEQEQEKDQLEQTKDLFNQAQSLIDAVIQLMQAVSAAESQSMRDAIQA